MTSQIIEVGFDITSQEEHDMLFGVLDAIRIAYYIQPQRNPPWTSLDELEAACEGK